jgi:hypothetical protein
MIITGAMPTQHFSGVSHHRRRSQMLITTLPEPWYLVPQLGKTKLTALKTADVRGMLNRIRQQCQCCAQGVAVAEEVLTHNVASFAKPTRPRRHRFQTWSVAEATTFLATIREHRFMHYSRWPSRSACAGARHSDCAGRT